MEQKTTKKDKSFINIVIIITIFISLLLYMIYVDGIDNMLSVIKSVKPIWVLAGLLCMIMYWILESFILYIISKKFYKTQRFRDSIRVTMIGQLFNSITPFASGGQPMQALTMVNEGKSVSNSAIILLIKFIVFQATLVLYTLAVIIFKYTYFKNLVSNFINLALIGFSVNLVIIIFLITIGINKKVVMSLLKPLLKLINKIGLLKNADEKISNLEKSISKFHDQFKSIKDNKLMVFSTVVISFIQHTVFFAVTYMVYRAFGQNSANIMDIMSAQAFLMMIMSFVPIPGAGLAAEGGFYIIFKTFFEKNTINLAILFWRNYTFYLPIIVGAMFILFKSRKYKLYKKEEEI